MGSYGTIILAKRFSEIQCNLCLLVAEQKNDWFIPRCPPLSIDAVNAGIRLVPLSSAY